MVPLDQAIWIMVATFVVSFLVGLAGWFGTRALLYYFFSRQDIT